MQIGEAIRQLRESYGMTQAELGNRIGVTRGAVMQFERGYKAPSLRMLGEIATVFGTTPADILSGAATGKAVKL